MSNNQTSLDPSDYCTLAICPIDLAYIYYVPSLAGNAFYAGIFGLFLLAQCILGIRFRTWGYLAGLLGGLVLEVIGYVGRLQLHNNPFKFTPYLE